MGDVFKTSYPSMRNPLIEDIIQFVNLRGEVSECELFDYIRELKKNDIDKYNNLQLNPSSRMCPQLRAAIYEAKERFILYDNTTSCVLTGYGKSLLK